MAMRYQQQTVSFLTMHGKERVIAPVLEQALGCRVFWVGGFDTDTLGSFSRETPRLTSALATCRRKAQRTTTRSRPTIGPVCFHLRTNMVFRRTSCACGPTAPTIHV
jgi:hypothetical protein